MASLCDSMPFVVKVTIAGMAIEPPTFDLSQIEPSFAAALQHLVDLNIAVASVDCDRRSYRLTSFGHEVLAEITSRPDPTLMSAAQLSCEDRTAVRALGMRPITINTMMADKRGDLVLCDALVRAGIAEASVAGCWKTYSLTDRGQDVFALIDSELGPEAA